MRPRADSFLTCLCETELSLSCGQLSLIEPRNRKNRDHPSATTEATLPEKTQDFAPESLFQPEFTRSRPADDVVDMMRKMAMTIVNSEVSYLNFL
jgi:hypothetical protein